MAYLRRQAWLTSVTEDNQLVQAMVLANSLRKTKTTRRLGVLIGENVSQEGRLMLECAFDHVFHPKEQFVSGVKNNELRGKCCCFCLEVFDKCVFVAANCVAIENCDQLFQGEWTGARHFTRESWSVTGLTPSSEFGHLLLCQRENSSEELDVIQEAKHWLIGQQLDYSEPNLQVGIWKLFLDNGTFDSTKCLSKVMMAASDPGITSHPAPGLVIFGNLGFETDEKLEARLEHLGSSTKIGLYEKIVIKEWLTIRKSFTASAANPDWIQLGSGYPTEPIAVVATSFRLPGANNPDQFWSILSGGMDMVTKPPAFRWTKEQTLNLGAVDWQRTEAGFLAQRIDLFDAKFFGLSPLEVETLDPQARLLMELTWEALENGAINAEQLSGTRAAVFVGSWLANYNDIVSASTDSEFLRGYLGNGIGSIAARLSSMLGLTGPCIATESGCSSAIVALDLAVKSLRSGETNLAIVGGVNLLLHAFNSELIRSILSPSYRCHTFDAKADGFARAEGVAVLIAKRLGDALNDKDNILALIRGSALSQEGLSPCLGTPTVESEALAMHLALKNAGVTPHQVSFVEAHGTGTVVGDSTEVQAIAKAYLTQQRDTPLVIGSVKTNVGHTESCSGLTGVIKTVLSLNHELIPKHLNLSKLSPAIDTEALNVKIPLDPQPWPKVKGQPRLAGVSSFGISGTDGHVILEEAPDYQLPKIDTGLERPLHLIKFSAKSEQALEDLQKNWTRFLAASSSKLADLAYTANVGRASFQYRAFLVAGSVSGAEDILQKNKLFCGSPPKKDPKLCFLFTGQGSQYPGMAKLLYDTSPVFRYHFEQCDTILRTEFELDITRVLWECEGQDPTFLSQTKYSQPSIFCVEYCLFKLWQSWGLHPDVVLGHSVGEFGAAVAAGILTFNDAIKLITWRSKLIDALPPGHMLVLNTGLKDTEALLLKHKIDLDIAAVNSSCQTVVAGQVGKVAELFKICQLEGVKALVLESAHAFHSREMEPILQTYKELCSGVTASTATCGYISGLEGKLIERPHLHLNADYWARHTRERVRFVEASKALQNYGHFLELGAHPVLSAFVMENLTGSRVSCYPSLRRNANDWRVLLSSLGQLYVQGFKVNWPAYDKPYNRQKVANLPTHPFHRKSYWVQFSQNWANAASPALHPLVGHPVESATKEKVFQAEVSLQKGLQYLEDHCIGSKVIFPGACYMEMCLMAGCYVASSNFTKIPLAGQAVAVKNVRIKAPLEIAVGAPCQMQTVVGSPSENGFECGIYNKQRQHAASDAWTLHCSSEFKPFVNSTKLREKFDKGRVAALLSGPPEMDEAVAGKELYRALQTAGLCFGSKFRTLTRFRVISGESSCVDVASEMNISAADMDVESYMLFPLIIDAMMQTVVASGFEKLQSKSDHFPVPVGVGQLTVVSSLVQTETKVCFHAIRNKFGNWSVCAYSSKLEPLALMENLELVQTSVKKMHSALKQQLGNIPESWTEVWKPICGPLDNRVVLENVNLTSLLTSHEFQREWQSTAQFSTQEDAQNCVKLNKVVTVTTLQVFTELGWRPQIGDELQADAFCRKYRIEANFQRLVAYFFAMIEEHGDLLTLERQESSQKNPVVWRITSVHPNFTRVISQHLEQVCREVNSIQKLEVVLSIQKNMGLLMPQILRGEVTPLSILFPGENASKSQLRLGAHSFYANYPGVTAAKAKLRVILATILKHHRAHSPGVATKLRVLEVGAGTGSGSEVLLKLLQAGPLFEYYFTDISPAFFVKAREKFSNAEGSLVYKTFNLEESPLDQGIPVNYFDVVMAYEVLHTTRNLKECLRNVRQVMRPNASFCFVETVSGKIDRLVPFVFGVLDGYWRFEDLDLRQDHCCLDGPTWKKLLLASHFENVLVSDLFCGSTACVTASATGLEGWALEPELRPTSQKWLLLAPNGDLLWVTLAEAMQSCGKMVKVVLPVASEKKPEQRINEVLAAEDNIQGVIYAWGTNTTPDTDQSHISLPLLLIAQWVLRMGTPAKICVLTRRRRHGENELSCPAGATLLGMVRCLKNENTNLCVKCVDTDMGCGSGMESVAAAVDEILYEINFNKEAGRERDRVQVVYREGSRYEPRLTRASLAENAASGDLQLPPFSPGYQLQLPSSKLIDELQYTCLERAQWLGESEVEIEIKACSLNFRDIFAIIKPTRAFECLNNVGVDYAGVVSRVGGSVSGLQVGGAVMGIKYEETALPSHVVVDCKTVIRIPKDLTFQEAASLPLVYATAIYCLHNVGKIKKGEWVLIHTASGGVGLAAVHIVKQAGAKLVATAGSGKKREFLRNLGVEHVFHSRDTSYEKDILRVTNGRGVDFVLNSITGPGFKEATLAVCATNGRFVEMSKLNIWTPEDVKQLRPDVSYSVQDLGGFDLEQQYALASQLTGFFQRGDFEALPYTQFDALRIRTALKYFQKAEHIGKVVITMPERTLVGGETISRVWLFNAESTYLITGGLGGIGLQLCKWMLEKGAKHVVLVGRNPPKPEVAEEIEQLVERGYKIGVSLANVGDKAECKRLIEDIGKNWANPLRGVNHCAGVLRDNLYPNQSWSDYEHTFCAKVRGTWNLHSLTRHLPLEHFVVHSSLTALLGVPGQGNHAAANCFLDSLVRYRRELGLPGTSVNWGQWGDVGVARNMNVAGMLPVSLERMLNGLEEAMRENVAQIGIGDLESVQVWIANCPALKYYMDDRILRACSNSSAQGGTAGVKVKSEDFWRELKAKQTEDGRRTVIVGYLKCILRHLLRMDEDEILSLDTDLSVMGVDSLMRLELRSCIVNLVGETRISDAVANRLKDCQCIVRLADEIHTGLVGVGDNDANLEQLCVIKERDN